MKALTFALTFLFLWSATLASAADVTMHVLAIGINSYPGKLKLDCAAGDAQSIADAFSKHARDIYKVQSKVLLNRDATRSAILKSLDELAAATKNGDLAIFFYAGHGDNKLTDQFRILPVDADTRKLAQTGISTEELRSKLGKISCKTLVIMDCCYAGAWDAEKGVKKRALSDHAKNLVNELANDKGLVVMCGAGKDEESAEEAKKGHGYFTQALIEGLSGKARPNKRDGMVYLSALEAYVEERVRELSNDEQFPTLSNTSVVRSFPLSKPPVGSGERESLDLTADIRAYERAQKTGAQIAFLKDKAPERLADWRQAAEKGDVNGEFLLAKCLMDGLGTDKDQNTAFAWFRKAALAGHAPSMNYMGYSYASGRGVEKDPTEAAKWHRKAAEAGDQLGMTNMARLYTFGLGVAKDEAEAAKWYRKAAEVGNSFAMYSLGNIYASGRGVEKDNAEAARWYRKSAEAGYLFAMNHVGWLYQSGLGVDKNEAEAVNWYRKAADGGNVPSMNNLGAMYDNGRGVEKDEKEALKWFRKAAEGGNVPGMNNLGAMYDNGRGVEKDEKEALKWFRKAAEAGNLDAIRNLGFMYEYGRGGLEKDVAEAIRWYKKAAERGHVIAKESLARLGAGDSNMPKSMEFVRPGVFIPKKESAPPPKVGPKRDLEAEIIMPPQPKDRKQVNAIDGVYKFNTDSIVKEQNGKEIWRARVDEGPFHQLVVVSADSRVVYVSGTKVVALDTATGKLMWTSPIPQLAETKEAAAWISGSGVVSVSVNNQIIRYNTRDGSKK